MRNPPITTLIVEDSSADAEMIERMLSANLGDSYPVKCVRARLLSEAEDLLHQEAIDVTLVDLNLPDSQGLDTLLRLQVKNPNIPMIILTGLENEEMGLMAIQKGAQDYLVKGQVEARLLQRAIRYAIERKLVQKALRNSQERFQELFANVPIGVYRTTPDGRILATNPAGIQMLGYESFDELAELNLELENQQVGLTRQEFRQRIEREGEVRGLETEWKRKDGSKVVLRENARVVRGQEGEVLYYEGTLEDITERKQAEEQLEFLATHDQLTGLPNRMRFRERLERGIARSTRRIDNLYLGILLLDLDNFKIVNDTYGHIAGDQVLRTISRRMQKRLRKNDTVARLGGDEFAIILEGIPSLDVCHKVAQDILEIIQEPVDVGGQKVQVGASIGISLYPFQDLDVEALLMQADLAMYLAKDGPDKIGIYEDNLPNLGQEPPLHTGQDQGERLVAQVKAGRERLKQLAKEVIMIQEKERRWISGELHDDVGQTLTYLLISLKTMRSAISKGGARFVEKIDEAVTLVNDVIDRTRRLAVDLRPPALDTLGLNTTLDACCEEFIRRTHIPTKYSGSEAPELPEMTDITLYRFLQEALTNVSKHAQASRVSVALQHDEHTVRLKVKDNGRGFDQDQLLDPNFSPVQRKLGLMVMKERFELLGGELDIRSKPGSGVQLIGILPLEAETVPRRTGGNPGTMTSAPSPSHGSGQALAQKITTEDGGETVRANKESWK